MSGLGQKILESDSWLTLGSGLTELLLLRSGLTESLWFESGLVELHLVLSSFFHLADRRMILIVWSEVPIV